MFSLLEVLGDELKTKITIVDVGAASLGEGTDPYDALLQPGRFHVIGFEPVEEQCELLKLLFPKDHTFLPYFIADGSTRTFHFCSNSYTSSLYEPYSELLNKFQHLEPGIRVNDTLEVETRCLDDIEEISDIDFLKLDVQGAELDVIKGASRLLESTLVVHTEVEFIPLYRNQPLFGDIDVALRSHNFLIHKFMGIAGRQMKPFIVNGDPFAPLSQILYAEAAVYVKNFMEFEALTADKLLRLATILHEVYGSYDLCAIALDHYDLKKGTSLNQAYIHRLRTLNPADEEAST
jgi:FkbM family methyltransferase